MIEEREIAKLSKKFCEECKNRGFQCEVLKVYDIVRMIQKYHPFLVYKTTGGKMSGKQRKKNKLSNRMLLIIEILCVLIFLYAALQLVSILQDYYRASKEYDHLAEVMVVIDEAASSVESDSVIKEEREVPDYYVDLEALKEQNADTIGWIILPDSKINYPIVLSKDNTEYLTTTFERKKSSSGAIFVDMYCNGDFSCKNTIIYGHNMKNGSMFRALNNMTDQEYFDTHHTFCIDTGDGFEYYEVISCYETVETNLISWKIDFESMESYENWLESISKRCTYDCADYDVNKNTITLSTCRGKAGGPGRFIVHLQKK